MIPSAFPEPEIFSPQDEPRLRWGILAPGWIAGFFAGAVNRHTNQDIVAVASRTLSRAEEFAATHGIDRAYGSYLELVENADIDVVYVAAPHSEHLELGLLAITAGKHVLIEKPLTTNAADARILVEAATSAGVLLMEAMWSRYQPQASVVRTLVADGMLGEIMSVAADHGQAMPVDLEGRMYNKSLGGGALLDLGVYPIQFDSMVLGKPTSITAVGGVAVTGVDEFATLVLAHGERAQSTITTSMLARTPTTAVVAGTQARVEVEGPFHIPTSLRLSDNNLFGPVQIWNDPTGVQLMDGLAWQATALAKYVGEGRRESPLHTLDETVSILETIDEARHQIGVT
ncbi:Gfo/Idh/MocA family oxidoreductase [Agromyces sp. ISL-38]|uniref:Gfo/Idh/MocA family protein n=1 Tax=Agromyces sp. ISL-38 TaxID=2819107 RepID=UPI001BED2A3F|nr:Gfo/Idh/MocA family oxidoreductase [Agromyces sp. ISL-38]MBT2498583.1 Gfo/Idh/MocA family oxidoreductase [Agromyces sp. ISL-38]